MPFFHLGNFPLLLPCASDISTAYNGCHKQFHEMKDAVFYALGKIRVI